MTEQEQELLNKHKELEATAAEKEKELKNIQQEIEDYKKQQDTINENILRARELAEKAEFYSIQIDENDKHDIDVLNKIKTQLLKIDKLNKMLYDNYVSKSTKEMVKRVLQGKDICGIYKVTNKDTNEIYIGKSTNIGNRWTNHVKSACGLEGVADSQFQRALKKYGVDNFTWELLEEVSKEKLGEREKYWIDYFNTTTYGYNERRG